MDTPNPSSRWARLSLGLLQLAKITYLPDGAISRFVFELRIINNIEPSRFPGSKASNWEFFKKTREEEKFGPIDLLASL